MNQNLNIHTHSEYSTKDAISKVKDIANWHKENGCDYFCITDHGTMACYPEAFGVARELNMNFIPGIEFYMQPPEDIDKKIINEKLAEYKKEFKKKTISKEDKEKYRLKIEELEKVDSRKNFHLTAIAVNKTGLNNLIYIYNEGNLYYKHRITKESLFNHSDGIIVLSACLGGELAFYIKRKEFDKAEKLMLEYKKHFGDRYFVEIMYHGSNIKSDQEHGYLNEKDTYLKIIELANKNDVQLIATNDAHYIHDNEKHMHDVYKAMCYFKSEDAKTGDLGFSGTGYHLTTKEELSKRFLDHDYDSNSVNNMFDNIEKIIDMYEIGFDIDHSNTLVEMKDLLRKKTKEGWEKIRKGTPREQESLDRIKKELEVIEGKNFTNYFINVKKIVDEARDLNIMTGPGRGSGAGSEIVYLTGITKTDPLEYGLLFERFLNPSRMEMPDIDLDIESTTPEYEGRQCRDVILEAMEDTFKFHGKIDNIVKGSTLVLFKKLASFCGLEFQKSNKLTTSDIGKEMLEREECPTKEEFKNVVETIGYEFDNIWEDIYKDLDICYKLDDIVFGSSVHASGVIMSEKDVNIPKNTEDVVNFNGKNLEKYDYIKYDILSLSTLNFIHYFYGLDYDWNDVYDDKVWDTICSGDVDYVFQLGGAVPKQMIKEGQPRTIEGLAEISAINRPGPLNMGLNTQWAEVKKGEYEFTGDALILKDILQNAFGEHHTGLLVFQEDVMRVCVDGAGFNLAEADSIRKAIGKKQKAIMDIYKPKFIEGWKRKQNKIKIEGLGTFNYDYEFELANGNKIKAYELFNRINNGEEIEIKD